MMKIVVAGLFLACLVTALPNDNVVPDTEFAEVDMTEAHEAAKQHIQQLLESGKSDDECKKLADAGIKTAKDSISASQKVLDSLETGKTCKGLQQALVDSTKKTLDSTKSAHSAATTAASTAKKAPVKFADINIAQVKANDCAAFTADPAYISAKKASTAADKKKAETSGALKVAQKAYDDAVAAQKKAIQDCSCKAQNAMLKEVPAVEKAYAATADEWKKSHLMKCVLGGTAMSSCNVPSRPALKKPTLVEPAKSANCPTCTKLKSAMLFDDNTKYTGGYPKKWTGSKGGYAIAGDFTISAKVKPTSRTNDWARVLGKGLKTPRNYGLWISHTGYALAQTYGLSGCSDAWVHGQSNSFVPLNKWTTMTQVYSGSHNTLYVNGVKIVSRKCTGGSPRTSTDPLTIGAAAFHTAFKGEIKDAMVLNKALSVQEVADLASTSC